MQGTHIKIPGSRISHGGGNSNPLQYSCLGNPTDRWATIHGVIEESDTIERLSMRGREKYLRENWSLHIPLVSRSCTTGLTGDCSLFSPWAESHSLEWWTALAFLPQSSFKKIHTGKQCKTPESPLDCKEINPVNPKWNQPWIVTGRADAEALILWPPDAKSWLTGKDPDAGKDWRQKEKGTT